MPEFPPKDVSAEVAYLLPDIPVTTMTLPERSGISSTLNFGFGGKA